MNIEQVKISEVLPNKDNPRMISDYKMNQLVTSIKEFPDMLKIRPIVVDDKMVVLGGNMRLEACKKAGLESIYIIKADDLTNKQKREFIIKDNVGFGEWDWDILDQDWDIKELEDWGLEIPVYFDEDSEVKPEEDLDEEYTTKIESPIYEITGEKPSLDSLVDTTKADKLISRINKSGIEDPNIKEFLVHASHRHKVFSYDKIAEYYAHCSPEIQSLMEESALIIIDFDKAIQNGFVSLSEDMAKAYKQDESYDEE